MIKKNLVNLYEDYFNNYLTVDRVAEDYEIDVKDMETLLNMGKKYREEEISKLQKV